MNLAELHTRIDLDMNEANAPWFTAAEKDDYINKAAIDVVEEEYSKYGSSEYNAEAMAVLTERQLIAIAQTLPNPYGTVNLDALVVPQAANGSYFMHVLKVLVDSTDQCGRKAKYPSVRVEVDDLEHLTLDPFKFPSSKKPRHYVVDDAPNSTRILHVYVDHLNSINPPTITAGAVHQLYYLRSPRKVSTALNIQPELSALLHDRLAERAVTLMLEQVEAARRRSHESVNT